MQNCHAGHLCAHASGRHLCMSLCICLCACSVRGLTRLRWLQHACFMYKCCSSLLFSPWISQQGDIHLFAQHQQDACRLRACMQSADQDLHALIYSDGCGPHASAFADIPPSVYRPSINRLQHTCYLPTVMPVNAWRDTAVLLLAALSVAQCPWQKSGRHYVATQWYMEGVKKTGWREEASGCMFPARSTCVVRRTQQVSRSPPPRGVCL